MQVKSHQWKNLRRLLRHLQQLSPHPLLDRAKTPRACSWRHSWPHIQARSGMDSASLHLLLRRRKFLPQQLKANTRLMLLLPVINQPSPV